MMRILLPSGESTLIDDCDFPVLSQFRWRLMAKHYVGRDVLVNGKKKTVLLHRWLLNAPDGCDVDHKDGNGLNNQRENLRLATVSQNMCNARKRTCRGHPARSRFKGVCLRRDGKKWCAAIMFEGVRHHLGARFDTEEQAARAYDLAALKIHGEFAKLNFPQGSTNAGL